MKNKERIKKLLLILTMTLISSIPVFFKNNALIQGDDINFHLKRIIALTDNLKIEKILPVYYNYLNHFGYGNGLFYPDLFLYIPAIFHKYGISIINSCKIFILLINLFSLMSINICIKKITYNEKSSKIGIILYATSLYRFTDMYERGALGEALTFIFIPFVILGLYKLFYEESKESFYLIIGLVGLLFSHVITSYITIILTVVVSLINYKKLKEKKILSTLIMCIIISMLITASFWMPLIEQLFSNKFNLSSHIMILENCVPFMALFMDFQPIIYDEWLPAGIGLIYYASIFFYYKYYKKNNTNKFLNTMYILGIITMILSSVKYIWKNPIFYKIFSIIQFPWRLYSLGTCILLIATVLLIEKIKNKKIITISIIYSLIIFLLNSSLNYINVYIDNNLHQDSIMFGEYLPIEMSNNYEEIINNYENKNISYHYENEKLIVEIKNNKDEIEVPLIYYKGYVAKENDKKYIITKSDNGLVKITINENTKKLEIYYEGTNISKNSKYLSLLGIISFLVYYMYKKR